MTNPRSISPPWVHALLVVVATVATAATPRSAAGGLPARRATPSGQAALRGTRQSSLYRRLSPAAQRERTRLLGDLVAKLTLDQKIGQLNEGTLAALKFNPEAWQARPEDIHSGRIGTILAVSGAEAVNRLQREFVERSPHGIPAIFAYDSIHGHRTDFGINLGLAATFEPKLVHRVFRAIGREAGAAGVSQVYSPMLDLVRGNAFWGRAMESAGEDPLVAERMARAAVRGLQEVGIAATPKHFLGYGANEGPEYSRTRITDDEMADFIRPFRAALRAGARAIMWAFNDLNGTPATGSTKLNHLLRETLGGKDVVGVSDWNSVAEQMEHGVAADLREAARRAIHAGVDRDMSSGAYLKHLGELVRQARGRQRKILVALIDTAVERVLGLKYDLGLFHNPYVPVEREAKVALSPAHRQLAREAARKAIVLLKNDPHDGREVLPLARSARTIAVVGPLADSREDPLGNWHAEATPDTVVSMLEGVQTLAGQRGARVLHARGGTVDKSTPAQIGAAVRAARAADVTVVVVGESFRMTGEAQSRDDLGLPGDQQRLVDAIHATGKPYVVVLMNGRPLAIPEVARKAPAILETWFGGVEAGNATADILFGEASPSGKLPITFPRSEGQARASYYGRRSTGRPALDADNRVISPGPFRSRFYNGRTAGMSAEENGPLFPFGHGLTYTRFAFENLQLSASRIRPAERLRVRATIRNTGEREGTEVVQLYLGDVVRSTTPPVKELADYQRVTLAPGEARTVEFIVDRRHLSFFDAQMRRHLEPGQFRVWVAPSSEGGLRSEFELAAR
jgi:beta-glucosidase